MRSASRDFGDNMNTKGRRGALGKNLFLVCANPRVGSTYFCEAIASTGVLGKPTEMLGPDQEVRLRREWNCADSSYGSYLERAVYASRTPNCIGGIKIMWAYLPNVLESLAHVDELAPLKRDHERFGSLFCGARALHLIRRNKVRAAFSYWLAQQTGQWVLYDEASRVAHPGSVDNAEITRLHDELHDAEAGWPHFLDAAGIETIQYVYEHWTIDVRSAVTNVAQQLFGIAVDRHSVKPPKMLRQATSITDDLERKWIEVTGGCSDCRNLN